MDELFLALGTALASICGADFEEARVRADLFEGHTSIEYACKRHGQWIEGIDSGADDNFAVYFALQQIKTDMGNSWNRCVFTFDSSCKFRFDTELVENPLDRDDLKGAFGGKP